MRETFLAAVLWLLLTSSAPMAAADEPQDAGPVTATYGALFFGGNRMHSPYVLSYVSGRLCVNGFALPQTKLHPASARRKTRRELEEESFAQRAADRCDSLRAVGASIETMRATVASMCRSSSLLDSFRVRARAVDMFFRSGSRVPIGLWEAVHTPPPRVTRAEMLSAELHQLRTLLDSGSTMFVLRDGVRITAHEDPDKMVSRALAGQVDSKLQRQLRHPLKLERLK